MYLISYLLIWYYIILLRQDINFICGHWILFITVIYFSGTIKTFNRYYDLIFNTIIPRLITSKYCMTCVFVFNWPKPDNWNYKPFRHIFSLNVFIFFVMKHFVTNTLYRNYCLLTFIIKYKTNKYI